MIKSGKVTGICIVSVHRKILTNSCMKPGTDFWKQENAVLSEAVIIMGAQSVYSTSIKNNRSFVECLLVSREKYISFEKLIQGQDIPAVVILLLIRHWKKAILAVPR